LGTNFISLPLATDGVTSTVFGNYAWYDGNSDSGSGQQTQVVGTRTAHLLAIHDMSGNVFELCWDWFGSYPVGPENNYLGIYSDPYRVKRGGSVFSNSDVLQLGSRYFSNPSSEFSGIGFRVVSGQ